MVFYFADANCQKQQNVVICKNF